MARYHLARKSSIPLLAFICILFGARVPDLNAENGNPEGIKYTLPVGNDTREYYVAADGCEENCPLVIDMHGLTSNAGQQQRYTKFYQNRAAWRIIAVWPQGLSNSWNAGSGGGEYTPCCGDSVANGVDDAGFLLAMVEKLKSDYPRINPSRIYLTGHSNGCAMAQNLLTNTVDIFAAGACTSMFIMDLPKTYIPRAVPFMGIHGIKDVIVPYEEEPNWRGLQYPGVAKNEGLWKDLNNCAGEPAHNVYQVLWWVTHSIDRYTTCDGSVSLVQVTINRATHLIHNNPDDIDVTQLMWDFLSPYALP